MEPCYEFEWSLIHSLIALTKSQQKLENIGGVNSDEKFTLSHANTFAFSNLNFQTTRKRLSWAHVNVKISLCDLIAWIKLNSLRFWGREERIKSWNFSKMELRGNMFWWVWGEEEGVEWRQRWGKSETSIWLTRINESLRKFLFDIFCWHENRFFRGWLTIRVSGFYYARNMLFEYIIQPEFKL